MTISAGQLLIVDDDEATRGLVARRFEAAGYQVTKVPGGAEALDLLANDAFDLMLLDVVMPDMDGFEVLERARTRYSSSTLPIIMFTIDEGTGSIVRALDLGANDYINKPLNFPVALARVRAQVAHKHAQDALRHATIAARRATEEADDANRAKSSFLASMSHELRTPLNAIIGFSEMIEGAHLGPINAKYREYASDINGAGHHLLKLINDILDLSKIDAGRMELHDEPTSLAALLRGCEALVAPRAAKGAVTVVSHIGDSLPLLRLDQTRMKQVLLNILDNAVKFTLPGGSVSANSEVSSEGMMITISDTGVGMRPEDIPLVLQPFRQADSCLARAHEGSGLGLPIASRLVEAHGGSFDIKSQLGAGTTVTIRLPADRILFDLEAA